MKQAVQPQVFAVRTSESAWLLLPYNSATLCDNLHSMMGAGLDVDAETAIEMLASMDCSLVVDPGPDWGVELFAAGSLTEDDLRKCDIAS